jgi:hypothetical protein
MRPLLQTVVRKQKAKKSKILVGFPYKDSLEDGIRETAVEQAENITKDRRKVADLYETDKTVSSMINGRSLDTMSHMESMVA